MSTQPHPNRREILGLTLTAVTAWALGGLSKLLRAEAGGPGLVSEGDPLASALKYHHDLNTVPANLKIKRAGVEFANQTCRTCVQYVKKSGTGESEMGTCKIISSGLVKGGGWCISWAKKPSRG